MNIYTIGFTQKTAEQFFTKIKNNNIQVLIDVRLNNQSQLSGFAKEKDLAYFLKVICDCQYSHEVKFAPTKDILDNYKKGHISWDEYVAAFNKLIEARDMSAYFQEKYMQYENVLLLCSEATPEKCHRRLLAECFAEKIGCQITHL